MIATDHKCQAGSNAATPVNGITFASDNASAPPAAEPEDHSHFENAISRVLKGSTRPSRQRQTGEAGEASGDKVEEPEQEVRPIPSNDGAITVPAILHPFVICQLPSLPEASIDGHPLEATSVSGVVPEAADDQKTEHHVASEIQEGSPSAASITSGVTGITAKEADTGINSAQISATMRDPAKTGQNQHALPSAVSEEAKSARQVISTLQFDATEDVTTNRAPVEQGSSLVLDSFSGVNAELPVATFGARFDSTDSIVETPATASGEISGDIRAEVVSQIVQCAVQMRRHHLETMTVALRFDHHTEIRLDLSVQGEQVNVQAQLERGDFGGASQRWSELQEELASRGVRLGNLQDFSWMTAAGNGRNFYSAEDDENQQQPAHPRIGGGTKQSPQVPSRTAAWERWA